MLSWPKKNRGSIHKQGYFHPDAAYVQSNRENGIRLWLSCKVSKIYNSTKLLSDANFQLQSHSYFWTEYCLYSKLK